MCSLFSPRMEKDQGDLADIVRAGASGGATSGGGGGAGGATSRGNWRIPLNEDGSFSSAMLEEPIDNFGDPFSSIHDPLLHELDIATPGFFDRLNPPSSVVKMNIEQDISITSSTSSHPRTIFDEDMRRPSSNNIFSRMLQISSNSKMSTTTTTPTPPPCDMISTVMSSPRLANKTPCSSSNESIKSNTMESVGMMQISSPRNPGIKRRKSQAKKVVCIPAPAAANSSRPSGEVVPSDLWAWRKYGQKPIKGSPYPRGYYRCSSSKGCSARKQVERSRTDPNMLVITYTSEHNHPWPTQRNALAGSTRSQPPKNNAASKSSTCPQTSSKLMTMKEEYKDHNFTESMSISVVDGTVNVTATTVKEEIGDGDGDGDMHERAIEMRDRGDLDNFHRNYGVVDANQQQPDDFFADLGELEYDPLKLLFTQSGFNGEKNEEGRENKALDPFSLFDWAGNSNMFGENKRGGGL